MNKKRFFLNRVFFSLSLLAFMSEANAETLIVEHYKEDSQQTEKVSYDLGDKPVLSFNGTNLLVNSSKANAEFALAKVAKYYFAESDPTLIEGNSSDGMGYFIVTEEGIRIIGFEPSSPVSLFSVNGQLIQAFKTSSEGSLEISLSNRPQGIYLVKTNNTTIKVRK